MCNRPCRAKWQLESTTTNPLNCKVRVTILSFISCLKELIKIQASSPLNLLNHLWVFWGNPLLKSILLPLRSLQVTHSNQCCSRDRKVQLENGSKFRAFQRKTLSDFSRLWISPKQSFSAATYPAITSQSRAGSSRRGGSWISAMGGNMPDMHFLGQPCLFTSQGTAVPAWPGDNLDYYAIIPF